MPRRQAKSPKNDFYQKLKKLKLFRFTHHFLSLPIIIGIVFAFLFVGFELTKTPYVAAYQLPMSKKTPVLYATTMLASPSATPAISLPVYESLQNSLEEQVTSEAAKLEPPYAQDYCIDVRMVMYHHVQPMQMATLLGHGPLTLDSDIFDEQMNYLKEQGYTALSVQDLVTALETRTTLPEKSVIITIDDGYEDNYTYAFMSAKKHKLLINFMVPTGLIGTSGYMHWEHLEEMVKNPYARIYNHSESHTALGLISKDDVLKEVETANNDLYYRLGLRNTIVVYPYGSYSNDAIATLKDLGIKAAVSTDAGTQQCLSNIMRLPRLRIGNAPMSSYGF